MKGGETAKKMSENIIDSVMSTIRPKRETTEADNIEPMDMVISVPSSCLTAALLIMGSYLIFMNRLSTSRTVKWT